MTQVKMKKLVIHKFLSLKHVSLDLDVLTTMSGKQKCAPVLPVVVQAIKFLCNRSDTVLNELQFVGTNKREKDDGSLTYVEGKIIFPDGSMKTFRRSIAENQSVFSIEAATVSEEDYRRQLEASGVISAESSRTFVLSDANVNTVVNFTDRKRSEFIDYVSGNEEIHKSYDALDKKINNLRIECDAARKTKAELTTEKKKLRGQIEADKNHDQLKSELNAQQAQLDLFTLFHNQALIEAIDDEVEHLKKQNDEARDKALEDDVINVLTSMKKTLSENNEALSEATVRDFCNLEYSQASYIQLLAKEMRRKDLEDQETLAEDTRTNQITLLSDEIEALEQEIELRSNETRLEHDKRVQELKDRYLENNKPRLDDIGKLKAKLEDKYDLDELERNFESRAEEMNENVQRKTLVATWRENLEKNKASIEEFDKKKQRLGELAVEHIRVSTLVESEEQRQKEQKSEEVINVLKQQFKDRIIGRLSSLWDAVNPEDKNLLESRLGEYKDAIVVDTKETALSCLEHLLTKQLISIDETFLPLSEVSNQKSTKSLLARGKLPTGVDCLIIEGLVDAQSEEVDKLVLRLAKPSLVTSSTEDAEKLLKVSSTKKVNIIDKESGTTMETRGTLSRSNNEEAGNLEDLRIKEHELELEKLKIQHEVSRDNLIIKSMQRRNTELETLIEQYTVLIEEPEEFNDPDVLRYEEALRELENDIEEHFKPLMEEINCKSLRKYEKLRESSDEIIKGKIAIKLVQRNELLAETQPRRQTSEDPELLKAKNATQSADQKFDLTFEKRLNCCEENFQIAYEIRKHKEARDVKIDEFLNKNERIFDELHKKQMALKENYETLERVYTEMRTMDLVEGSLEEFAVVPGEVTDDYQVVKEQLGRVQVNFNKLKNSLKHEADVATKAQEMLSKLEKLRSRIKDLGGKPRNDANEQRLKTVSAHLARVTKELDAKKLKLDEIGAELEAIKESRRNRFNDTIRAINESLTDFCNLAFDGSVVARLESVNENEPYLGDVFFNWATLDNPDHRLNENNRNYAAALAFLIGVTRLKKQSLVVLLNATQHTNFDLQKYFRNQDSQQVVLLSSTLSDDDVNYLIRCHRSSFAFSRMN